jgi:hypothetical protein
MTQPLKALAALPEEEVLFPAPTWLLTAVCNSSSRESKVFLPPPATGMHIVIGIHDKHPHTQNINNLID